MYRYLFRTVPVPVQVHSYTNNDYGTSTVLCMNQQFHYCVTITGTINTRKFLNTCINYTGI
jgi:hypothetical protein